MSAAAELTRDDLLKLARKLQRQNKVYAKRIEELEAQAAQPSISQSIASLLAPQSSAPPPPPPLPSSSAAAASSNSIATLEKALKSEQIKVKALEQQNAEIAEKFAALQTALETLSAEKQHLVDKYELGKHNVDIEFLQESGSITRKNSRIVQLKEQNDQLEKLLKNAEVGAALKDEQIAKLQKELAVKTKLLSEANELTESKKQRSGSLDEFSIPSPTIEKMYSNSNPSKIEISLRAQIEQLRLQSEESSRMLSEFRDLADEAEKRVVAAKSEVFSVQEECERNIESFKVKYREQNAKIAALYRKLGKSESEYKKLVSLYRDALNQISRLRLSLYQFDPSKEEIYDLEPQESVKSLEDFEEKIVCSPTSEEMSDYDLVLTGTQRYITEIQLLKNELEMLERSRNRTSENLDYLKNVMLKFLIMEKKKDERRTLLPVLQKLLHFSPQECQNIENAWK